MPDSKMTLCVSISIHIYKKKKLENRERDKKELECIYVTNDRNIMSHLPSLSVPALKNSCVQYWLLTFIITSLSSAQESPLGAIQMYSFKMAMKKGEVGEELPHPLLLFRVFLSLAT